MWSDKETIHDCLGFSSYVSSLTEVCLEPEIAPLTLGIFGSWGSGKTSLMRMLESSVSDTDRIKTVWANTWRYEGKDEAQSALINAILTSLKNEISLTCEAKEVFDRLKKGASILKLGKFIGKTMMTMTPDIEEFIKCFEDESDRLAETMAQFEDDFSHFLERAEIDRVVVFLDDLDRCQSEKIIETFETIKLFLNIPSCTFVIGADAGKIESAIRSHYKIKFGNEDPSPKDGRSFAEDYLEKIVQIPFRIPEQQLRDISCYTGMLVLKREISEEKWSSLCSKRYSIINSQNDTFEAFVEWIEELDDNDFVNSKTSALSSLRKYQPYLNLIAKGLKGNPRQIKRFLNIFELRRRLAKSNDLTIDENILIKILVLEYTWNWFFQELSNDFDRETGISNLVSELCEIFIAEKDADSESKIISDALETPGLADFISSSPSLEETDLRPYLFLAQTALHAQPQRLTPPEEEVTNLVTGISSKDRIVHKAAIRDTLRRELSVIASVLRSLCTKIHLETDKSKQISMARGISTITSQHLDLLPAAIDRLASIDLSENEALSLALRELVDTAENKGVDASSLEEALDRSKSSVTNAISKGTTRRNR